MTEYLDNIFWGAVSLLLITLFHAWTATIIADGRHPDKWHKEKVYTDSGSWKLVDVGNASETWKEDWVSATKFWCWVGLVIASVAGLVWIGTEVS